MLTAEDQIPEAALRRRLMLALTSIQQARGRAPQINEIPIAEFHAAHA